MSGLDSNPAMAQMSAARLTANPAMPMAAGTDMRKMRETAREFEAVFISQMLRPMFENIEAAAPFGGGPGEQAYRDMQIDEYGKAIAKAGGIGLADSVMREMIKMQESN